MGGVKQVKKPKSANAASGGKKARRTVGAGALFQRPDGTWVARFDIPDDFNGKRRRWEGSSKSRAIALNKMSEARKEFLSTGTVTAKNITVAAWLNRWLETIVKPKVKPLTFQDYSLVVRIHAIPAIGKVQLTALTPAHIRKLHAKVVESSSLGNANKVHRVLRASLSDAEREGLVPKNVAKLVQTSASKNTRASLTNAEAKHLLTKAKNDPLFSRWLMALSTGARQGECLGLTWDRVDFDKGIIDISAQMQQLPFKHGCDGSCGKSVGRCPKRALDSPAGFEYQQLKGSACLVSPKSASGKRIVPMSADLSKALKAQQKALFGVLNPANLVWPNVVTDRKNPEVLHALPCDRRKDYLAWHEALDAAGLPKIPLHSARHTAATLLMEQGVDVTIVQGILGHSEAATTRIYQHADLTMARKALDGLSKSLA